MSDLFRRVRFALIRALAGSDGVCINLHVEGTLVCKGPSIIANTTHRNSAGACVEMVSPT